MLEPVPDQRFPDIAQTVRRPAGRRRTARSNSERGESLHT